MPFGVALFLGGQYGVIVTAGGIGTQGSWVLFSALVEAGTLGLLGSVPSSGVQSRHQMKVVGANGHCRDTLIPLILMAVRATPAASMDHTPFEVVTGRIMPIPEHLLCIPTSRGGRGGVAVERWADRTLGFNNAPC